MLRRFIRYLAIVCLAVGTAARAEAVVLAAGPQVRLAGYTSSALLNSAQDIQILIKFDIADKWHILSPEKGDIGLPTTVTWKLPPGFEVVDEEWSVPALFDEDIIAVYGYAGEAYYLATIRPGDVYSGQISFEAEINWQACFEECVPGNARLKFTLPVVEHNVLPSAEWRQVIQQAEQFMFQEAANPEENASGHDLLRVMFMAFLGGLILNLMPCILPILSLKAIGLVKHIQNEQRAKKDAVLFFCGVLVSFLVMASFLAWFRMSGENIGWGFQLQSPWFIFVLFIIFLLIALMFLDVINVNVPLINKLAVVSGRTQRLSSFLTGVFSVVIASPCTAPFMGVAIGYTLTQPVYLYYPVFMSLAVGYALPFTLIGFFPRVISRILPKPGKWMTTLKHLFAIPVLLTCVWLAWVWLAQVFAPKSPVGNSSAVWRVYDEAEVSRQVEAGRNVFIDFTAKWCITCLANEKAVLETEAFAHLVQENDILLYKADWTSRDDRITKALAKYGRNSVPLYIYYDGQTRSMKILPQLLTIDTLDLRQVDPIG